MEIQFYKPSNPILEKYIEGFYFVTPKKINNQLKYWTFPNNFCIIAIYQNTLLELNNNVIEVSSSPKTNIQCSIVSRYIVPIEIIQNSITPEFCIYFKPLGINHFIDNVTPYFEENIQFFNPFEDFYPEMKKIFELKKREEQIQYLENFWIKKINTKNFKLLENIITDIESNLTINNIAEKYSISRQYVNKLFAKFIGKSPTEFRKIHRFRNLLKEKNNQINLTELTYQNQFYDQSHFIKDFKQFTSLNPKHFFDTVNTKNKNIWLKK